MFAADLVGSDWRLSKVDPVFVRPCPCVCRLDLSELHFSSSAAVVVLVRWSYGVLARQLPDCLLQQDLSGSNERGTVMAACLRLAPVLVANVRWSIDLVVIFITSCVVLP